MKYKSLLLLTFIFTITSTHEAEHLKLTIGKQVAFMNDISKDLPSKAREDKFEIDALKALAVKVRLCPKYHAISADEYKKWLESIEPLTDAQKQERLLQEYNRLIALKEALLKIQQTSNEWANARATWSKQASFIIGLSPIVLSPCIFWHQSQTSKKDLIPLIIASHIVSISGALFAATACWEYHNRCLSQIKNTASIEQSIEHSKKIMAFVTNKLSQKETPPITQDIIQEQSHV